MKKIILGSACLIWTSISFAGEALITGQGQVLSEPDYVELSMVVQSKCYSTPDKAREANDAAARKIVDYLNNKLSGEGFYNKVITQGGFTNAYQTYYQNKVLCQGTFQKTNQITFRSQKIESFEEDYDAIQKKVYEQFKSEPRSLIESSVTYVTMSNPEPKLSIEKRTELEQKALTMALNNAKKKFQALFDQQSIQNLKLTQVSEVAPNLDVPSPRRDVMMRAAPMALQAEKSNAPVQFDDEWIHTNVYFRFTFDDVALP